jgi:hypothetical protein
VTEFYSQEIQVVRTEKPGLPSAFTWQGKQYQIREIWGEWPDYGFGSLKRGRWWQRRHRTFFRVVTEGGEVFEIYLDRSEKKKKWFLYKRLDETSRSAPGKIEGQR